MACHQILLVPPPPRLTNLVHIRLLRLFFLHLLLLLAPTNPRRHRPALEDVCLEHLTQYLLPPRRHRRCFSLRLDWPQVRPRHRRWSPGACRLSHGWAILHPQYPRARRRLRCRIRNLFIPRRTWSRRQYRLGRIQDLRHRRSRAVLRHCGSLGKNRGFCGNIHLRYNPFQCARRC